jgi:predicted transglutaminase-like cysteine proteinase
MAASVRSCAIAALASLFIIAPLSGRPAVATVAEAISGAAPVGPIARPSFPVPQLRLLNVAIAEPVVIFDGTIGPISVAEEPEAAFKQVMWVPPRTTTTEFAPSIIVPPTDLSESYAEEFPGAVAVSVPRIGENPRWRRIVEQGPQALRGVECADGSLERCGGSVWPRWHELLRKVSALHGEERLQAVNEGMNDLLTYASDDETYGVGDHWATLEESMERGRGDCEDIAIAKMWLLNAAGIELSNMRLVVVKDTLRNLDHAVLSVVENGHQYVLDNTATKVGHADWMRGYRPIYALSASQSWIYGMRVPAAPPLQVTQTSGPVVTQ